MWTLGLSLALLSFATPAHAGPPFLTDDPDPTPYQHYEIYGFAAGERANDGDAGAVGIDYNYGGAPNLQLTATLPIGWENLDGDEFRSGLGNIELAAKYQFLHQDEGGWNVAVFPRLFLPTSSDLGDHHAALLLPVWIGRSGENWSTFGGGGCAINRGGGSQDYCLAGWAYTHRFGDSLQLGAELFHQTADAEDGEDATTLGVGGTYDVSERLHILGWVGDGMENTDVNVETSWYASVLFTF
jgi:hypothetical protein